MHSKVDKYIIEHSNFSEEIIFLRKIIQSTKLKETIKWGMPTYTINRKNVVGIGAFKTHFGLWFFKGSLLKDYNKVLTAFDLIGVHPLLPMHDAAGIERFATGEMAEEEGLKVDHDGFEVEMTAQRELHNNLEAISKDIKAVEDILKNNGEAFFIKCDVTKEEEVKAD